MLECLHADHLKLLALNIALVLEFDLNLLDYVARKRLSLRKVRVTHLGPS
jgi:hypothetical protein